MLVIQARNVNDAFPVALMHLRETGVRRPSRNGEVIEYPGPVATVYNAPCERILWNPIRDANPFFHLFEALWILAGRKDAGFLAEFNKRMFDYSDDGATFHAAYGERLRVGLDQLTIASNLLAGDPETRRAVLQIWDAKRDLGTTSRDLPCNDTIFLKQRDGLLHMTVCCRSNDVIWGAYGANVVQFSVLLEYLATRSGYGVGTYTQVSDSFHVYTANPVWKQYESNGVWDGSRDHYDVVASAPLFREGAAIFESDLKHFFRGWEAKRSFAQPEFYSTWLFREVVVPMYKAHLLYRSGELDEALGELRYYSNDWLHAGKSWLTRRLVKRAVVA